MKGYMIQKDEVNYLGHKTSMESNLDLDSDLLSDMIPHCSFPAFTVG